MSRPRREVHSCYKCGSPHAAPPRIPELIHLGDKRGTLTIVDAPEMRAKWLVRCDCGTVKYVRWLYLLNGRTRSCGAKGCASRGTFKTVHGKAGSPIYLVWKAMRKRCENSKDKGYKNYGARGIKVCERWRQFKNFYADMGDAPEGMSLDRIDNDGEYSPDNCRWTTSEQQANNQRTNISLVIDGERYTASQWARLQGIPPARIMARVAMGWPIESAFLTPKLRPFERKSNGTTS